MPLYEYIGQSLNGAVSGQIEGVSKTAAKESLNAIGITVTRIQASQTFKVKVFWKFLTLLNILLIQKVALPDALSLLILQENNKIAHASKAVSQGISAGKEIAEAISDTFPDIDPKLLAMLKIGTKNAGFSTAVTHILENRKKSEILKQNINKAIAYPLFVFLITIVVMVVLFDTILPEFKDITNLESASSLSRLILSFAGKGFSSVLFVLWVTIFGLVLVVFSKTNKQFRLAFDYFVFKFPLLHKVSKGFARGSFCEGLALGLSLNVDLKRVIEFSTSTVQNSYVKGRLDKINDCLLEGQTLEEALRRTGIFMSMQLAQIGIAEKTGYIAETICELSKADLEARMQRISIWSQFIGPIAILFLGFIIALVAISILSPMMDLQMSVD